MKGIASLSVSNNMSFLENERTTNLKRVPESQERQDSNALKVITIGSLGEKI